MVRHPNYDVVKNSSRLCHEPPQDATGLNALRAYFSRGLAPFPRD